MWSRMWQNLLPRPWLCSFLAILIYLLQRETRWAGYQLLINCLQCTKKTSTKLVNQILVDHIWNNFQVTSCFYMTYLEKWSFSIFLVVATVHRIIIEVWSTQKPSGRNYGGYRYHEWQMNFSFICHQKKRYTEQVAIRAPIQNWILHVILSCSLLTSVQFQQLW